jgi:curved DNA-binding protein CbpA
MAILARGTVGDRPWGKTLAALQNRVFDGEIALEADGKRYVIAFDQGAVVGASSPLATDAAVRVALTGGLITSSQAADLNRLVAARPGIDEVDVVATALKLSPDHVQRLRRRVIAHKAIRGFALDRGNFTVVDDRTLARAAELAIDVRALIFLGARTHMTEQRLLQDLAGLGMRFQLRSDVDLPQYGFGAAEQPIVDALAEPIEVAELDHISGLLDVRTARAVVYALAVTGALDVYTAATTAFKPDPAHRKQPTPRSDSGIRSIRPTSEPARARPSIPPDRVRTSTPPPDHPATRPQTPSQGSRVRGTPPTHLSRTDTNPRIDARMHRPVIKRATTPPPGPNADDVVRLIKERATLLQRGVDHFALLGVDDSASPDTLRKVYFGLARQLHPDRLTALGIADEDRTAQRLFAQINTAFAVLTTPARRAEYQRTQRMGGEAAVRAQQEQADELARRIFAAEEHFMLGEMALRRDQYGIALAEFQRAVELNPEEADHHAMLGWTIFVGASDRASVVAEARSLLDRAIKIAPRAVTPRLLLGKLERIAGRDSDAIVQFREVLRLSRDHVEASSELRILEMRAQQALAAAQDPKKKK